LPEETAVIESTSTAHLDGSPGTLVVRQEGGQFHFAKDRGGKFLAELLPPSENLPRLASDRPTGPRPSLTPPILRRPGLPWPENQAIAATARPGLPPRLMRPRPVAEEVPLALAFPEPVTPEQPLLAAGERAREASPDLREPLPLPVLGQKQPELPAAEDPTSDASARVALAPLSLTRMKPAPFLRLNLPDPFEHRLAVRLRREPSEDPSPVTAAPRLPGR
jgi:hypothetical protein